MSLRNKVITIFSLLMLFLVILNYAIQRSVIFPTYLDLEQSEAQQNLDRIRESIDREVEHINNISNGYAAFDDTYDYMVSNGEQYVSTNLTIGSFISYGINLISIHNTKGDIIWNGSYDLVTNDKIEMKSIIDRPDIKRNLVGFFDESLQSEQQFRKGVVNTGHGLLMVASRPILTSNYEGPSRGYFITGKFLDNNLVKQLIVQTRLNFEIISIYDQINRQKYEKQIAEMTDKSPYYFEKLSDQELLAYSIFPDIDNHPAFIIKLLFARDISSQGLKTINFVIVYILLVGVVVLLLFLLFTNSMILKPLSRLTMLIKKVEKTGDLSIRAPIESEDEIGILSTGFNRMMNITEQQTVELGDAVDIKQQEIEKRKTTEDTLQNAYKELQIAWKSVEEADRAKSDFLDNSGEGFLSFGKDLLIDREYSRECEAIFDHISCCSSEDMATCDRKIAGKDISELLFGKGGSDNKEGFKKTIGFIFSEPLELRRELYISLLPPVYQIKDKHIKAHYRLINDSAKMMLILTDISREKRLEKNIESERNRLKFVISAVREARDFFAILNDLRNFKQKTLPELLSRNHSDKDQGYVYEIYRYIHTFKGLFAQQNFLYFPEFLHQMESRLSRMTAECSGVVLDHSLKKVQEDGAVQNGSAITATGEDIENFAEDFINETVLEKDFDIIREFLGDQFMENKGDIVISRELALKIESMAWKLTAMAGCDFDHEILNTLDRSKRLMYVEIKSLLNPHAEGAMRLAHRLDRYINPFQAEGDDIAVHPDRVRPFISSLVNVFRNAIDHGIEEPEERLDAGKDEYATIGCSVKMVKAESCSKTSGKEAVMDGGWVEISISDDGRGVDLNAIRKKVVKNGAMRAEHVNGMSEQELLQLIFFDNFTTRESSDCISGRGMGLSSVKTEVEKLNGRVEIETEAGKGSCFRFYFQL